MRTGVVKKFIEGKSFGFIAPDDGGEDIFVHRNVCEGGDIAEGQTVAFEEEWNSRKQKSQATYCEVQAEAPVDQAEGETPADTAVGGELMAVVDASDDSYDEGSDEGSYDEEEEDEGE